MKDNFLPEYKGYKNFPTYAVTCYIKNNKLAYQYYKRIKEQINDYDNIILKLKELITVSLNFENINTKQLINDFEVCYEKHKDNLVDYYQLIDYIDWDEILDSIH